ncbi:MAG: extracellular solute-binding protein [Chloroflexi bacterium]|nr:extracellular solute-binding protein [Chloroflexota bacterium]
MTGTQERRDTVGTEAAADAASERPSSDRCPGGRPLSRRRLVAAGGSALAGAALAACGRGTETIGGDAAKSTQPVTLEFQHRWEGARTEVIDRVVATYQQQKPHVRVNSQLVFGSGEGFFDGMPYDKILTQIAAGTPPDVVMMGSDVASAWARRGSALRPLDEALRRDKIEPEKVFYPALAQMARAQGKYYGLPQLTGTDRAYLFINRDVVASAGLDHQKGPQSWDDLVAWSQKLTKRDGGELSQIGLASPGAPFIDWLARNNGKVLSDDSTKVVFDSPAGQETLQWMLDSANRLYGGVQAVRAFQSANRNSTYTGKVNLWTSQVAGFFTTLSDAPKVNPSFQLAVGIVPHNAKNAQAKPLSLAEKIWMYSQAAGASGARVDAGYDFLKHLTLGEGNKTFVLAQSRPSPVVRFNDDPVYKQQNPWWDSHVKRALTLMTPMPQTPAWNAMRTLLDRMTDRVMTGQRGVREALTEAAREGQRLLEEASR